MNERKPNGFVRVLSSIWNVINGTRKVVLNLIFLFLMMLFLGALFSQSPIVVEPRSALVINPVGMVVEQYSSDPIERALDQAMGAEQPEARFRDILRSILMARNDDRIGALVLDPDQLWSIGPAQLSELQRVVDDFRASGKPVYGYSEGMEQGQYAFASMADELWMHPEGLVFLQGYGVFRNYYKDALDLLDVNVHLFRVGEFKSAAEPFIRNDMSEESKLANRYWLNGLWQNLLDQLSAAREISPEALTDITQNYDVKLAAAGGSPSTMAIDNGLIDRVATRSEFNDFMIGVVADDGHGSFRRIGYESYIQTALPVSPLQDKVAIVVAEGEITFGDQPPGTVGGESTVRQIYEARTDKHVKAIVLRVSSPGGAVLPSEKIRQELQAARDSGLPVIVSMGTVAASGGYWISMSADQIFAEPTTITGSIGIFGLMFTIPRTLEKIGIHADGVGTTPLSDAFRPDLPMSEQARNIIQQIVDDGYESFINKVADSRGMSVEQVNEVARGRVWTGAQAHERGLVDTMGGLTDAIAAAAQAAGMGDRYGVEYFEKQPTAFEQWILDLSASIPAPDLGVLELARSVTSVPEELRLFLQSPQKPVAIYAHCFCSVQ